ncbi:amidase, hydantoinase/carbamoylase family protein [Yersinia pseudotuberculosis IP 32953]|uniref:Putative N-carbamyl-L-amino acid amidohydrolase n=2 Tax=Yersinia pseudotuberculosis TaxID=633 RepID=Q66E22_YERPS|nr:allantoate amidohydrolase [Yersinia pseudotuberculosis]CQD52160.1 allantoate amidohydrolase [Yersinia intermedia]AJJ02477.1 amidase, hydantoinase/carbamoylase family protein [Yersinia pseudotuberculosis]AJJ53540.1 amidase, hydantoinase/carbamoylase family protein [Yersinia pseudotuberculosis IP 32953]AJJ67813.1 amidase, hydantoinase/carbamoylase family protein [Yersinia pseudotuberculosis PB1/+]AJJ70997.1 amidase, hydantoinase/carbamoylase family protein [Yersinia pseudotuberculosis]
MSVTLPDIEAEQAALQVLARCDVLAAISESPEGLTRVYLSPEHLRANRQVGEWMQAVGMQVWQDTVGNICGRYEGRQPDAPAILLGSHLDTVRNAGRYDGMLGVLTALEVVGYLHRHQQRLPVAIEVIGFADEEGTRFGITLLGSKGVTGRWPVEWLNTTDADGISVAQAMVRAGLDPMDIGQSARAANAFCAYLELHIEQGPCLENAGLALGVVTDINGARRLQCQFTGLAGHAGTVPMGQRQDALAGAAEWMCAVEALTAAQGEHLVATVGTLTCLPGAVNVIPGQVRLTLDIRGPNDRGVNDLLTRLLAEAEAIATRRGITFAAEGFYRIKATACDSALQQCISQSISQVQGRCLALPSGAGHDAIAMAECWPVGMLFVRCKGGVSHHPDESVTSSDVAVAIQAYLEAVLTSPSSPSSLTPQRC